MIRTCLLNFNTDWNKLTFLFLQFRAEFEVPYAPGTLKAEGLRGDRVVGQSTLQTTGHPVGLKLTADRKTLFANGQDLAFVTVEAVDEQGRLQMSSNQRVHFSIRGAGTIAAVGSGDGRSQDAYSGDVFNLFNGRALVILRTTTKSGEITLNAVAEGLHSSSVLIESKPGSSLPNLP